MKMAKVSTEDLEMALELAAALEAVCDQWSPTMPSAIQVEDDDCSEPFSPNNTDQCERLFEYLSKLLDRGSLFRVVMGMAVLCDPKNKLIDPDDDCLAPHPEIVAALNAVKAAANPTAP
ncbi:MAG: hypothetical protein WC997_17595 [Porticoccaceae bacterium]